jgi:hypothetical protein
MGHSIYLYSPLMKVGVGKLMDSKLDSEGAIYSCRDLLLNVSTISTRSVWVEMYITQPLYYV